MSTNNRVWIGDKFGKTLVQNLLRSSDDYSYHIIIETPLGKVEFIQATCLSVLPFMCDGRGYCNK
jgi:hypothetical protein